MAKDFKTPLEKIHLVLLRDSRNPSVIEVSDVSKVALDKGLVIVFGSLSHAGDFNPYYFLYPDFLEKVHLCKFTQMGCQEVQVGMPAEMAIRKAIELSSEDLQVANTALGYLASTPMALKAMVCLV